MLKRQLLPGLNELADMAAPAPRLRFRFRRGVSDEGDPCNRCVLRNQHARRRMERQVYSRAACLRRICNE